MEDVKLLDKIKRFSSQNNGYGCGEGSGYGEDIGEGSGEGSGCGTIFNNGIGSGFGSGSGKGNGKGNGYGSGEGEGTGDGCGYGYGDGEGNLAEINGLKVFLVDNIATIFTSINGNVAKGFILQADMTMTPCYVVKGVKGVRGVRRNTFFAHGKNLHEAMEALTDKMYDDMSEKKRIAEFVQAHPDLNTAYPNQDLFDWHHRLTGSCMAGRNAFMKDRGLTLDGETTVAEFIRLTENAYNGYIIALLEEAYK